jgi:FlaA1/EpsC-like NDP-sugar epimerase
MKIFQYTSRAYASRLALVFGDVTASVLSLFLASWFRTNFETNQAINIWTNLLFLVLPVRILTFRVFRTYAVILENAGLFNVIQVVNAVLAGSLFNFIAVLLLRNFDIVLSLSVVVIDFFVLALLLASYRLLLPLLYYRRKNVRDQTPIIIIGGGDLGLLTKQMIDKDLHTPYKVIAFMDENPDLKNKSLDGIPIILPAQLSQYPAEKAIFAIRNITSAQKQRLLDVCLSAKIQVLKVPPVSNWLNEDFTVQQIAAFQIEDLLGRPAIQNLDLNSGTFYKDKSVLVTGAAGSIGSEIVRQLIAFQPAKIILLDQAESPLVDLALECQEQLSYSTAIPYLGSVTDLVKLRQLFERERPQVVFHAAAYKHVPIIEDYPEEAVRTNVWGTKNVATLADQYGVEKMVLVSTDKAVNPTNIMGSTKRIAELLIQRINADSQTAYITTRFGNVLGSAGSVVPRFRKQIEEGGPITVTHPEINRYFMTIPEASLLVVEAAVIAKGGEVVLFDMGVPVKIVDLAKKMIQLSGKDIQIKYTGLRKGEKLYEELLIDQEAVIDTPHPKLKIAKHTSGLVPDLEAFEKLIDGDHHLNLDLLKSLVPEYQSQRTQRTDIP